MYIVYDTANMKNDESRHSWYWKMYQIMCRLTWNNYLLERMFFPKMLILNTLRYPIHNI